jgi:predicted alpha-1,2-mannosidase
VRGNYNCGFEEVEQQSLSKLHRLDIPMNVARLLRNLHPLLMICALPLHAQSTVERPTALQSVHPLAGTTAEGQTFPSASVPFAMTQFTPVTRAGELKCVAPYYYQDKRMLGIRGSHFLSGSCTQDYGSFQLIAGAGELDLAHGLPSSSFTHAQETATPYLYSVTLPELATTVSTTGTARCGLIRFTMQRGGHAWLLVENNARAGDGETRVDVSTQEVTGFNKVRRLYAGLGEPAGFAGYFVVRFDHTFRKSGTYDGAVQSVRPVQGSTATPTGAVLSFTLHAGESVVARIGTSFTSVDEARRNLLAELPAGDFDSVVETNKQVWTRALARIAIPLDAPDTPVFYTALFHSLLLPRIGSDVSGSYPSFGGGKAVEHAKGFTYYDDFSAWDTFRALHPLFTIIDPERDGQMVQSLIVKGEQGGYLPIFPAWNSYTSEMVGDHATAIIGDAWMKGVRNFDITSAYALMYKNATQQAAPKDYRDGRGRRALNSYLRYGYIPLEDHVDDAFHKDEQVSRTLEYAYDDFVLSQVAVSLGKKQDAALFAKRAQNYRNVIDPETGMARGRHADGSWVVPFDPAKPATYITEGLPFQYTFFVPQDIPGLIQLEGGNVAFSRKLDELFARNLYNHGNEPSHHIAYLYDFAGEAYKTQSHVHDILGSQYHDAPNGLSGNDDAGQMSAWYVLSALGFYQVTPGIPAYAIGTPRFSSAVIHLPSGRSFHIIAKNAGPQNFYIQSATLNGHPLNRFWIEHAAIEAGGELVFRMGPHPNTAWPSDPTPPTPLK